MPMPTVYATGAAVSSTSTALTPAIPAGTTTNDIVLLVHEMDPALSAAVLGAVTGYTDVINSPQSFTTVTPTRLTVRWHRATGAESGTITVPAVTDHQSCRLIGFRGCVTSGNPWNVTSGATAASSATVNFPALTTTATDCLIFQAVATGTDANSTTMLGAATNAALASIAEQMDNWALTGGGGGFGAVTGQKATAGAVGTTTATLTTANPQALMSIAMQGAVLVAPPHRGTIRMSRAAVQRASRW
jgi:hypothetical protein